MTGESRIRGFFRTFFLTAMFLFFIAPFVIIFYNAFKTTNEFIENPLALPKSLNFSNFAGAFEKMNYMSAFWNTLVITAASVLIITVFTAMTAFYLVRTKKRHSQIIFLVFLSAMIIPFQALMIPLVKIYGSIGMLNSKYALMYMYLGFGAAMAVFIFHGFIKSIPLELEEAAMIDGSGRIRTFFSIIWPLLGPTTMTIAILDVLWIWNDYLLPSLVLITPEQRTLPLSTFYFYGTYTVDFGLCIAGIIMTTVPVLLIYLFMQKYILSGVMQGSIK